MRRFRALWLATLVVVTCREYGSQDGEETATGGSNTGGDATGGVDAPGGMAGGEAPGGTSAEETGGSSGLSGTAGGGGDVAPQPGIHGAVRLMRDGSPVCGGTLLSNSWVLTATGCFPLTTPASAITVGFGMDSNHFEQVRPVVEIHRFPGSDSGGNVAPGLMLLGVDAPFVIEGSTSEHAILFSPEGGQFLYGAHQCVGWDLQPDPTSPTNQLHSETLSCIAVSPSEGLERVWWLNADLADGERSALLTANDIGSGCFRYSPSRPWLTAVHSGVPTESSDNVPNDDHESYSTSVGRPEIWRWVDDTLFGAETHDEWTAWGEPAICSFSPETLEVFALREDGKIVWKHQDRWPSTSGTTPFADVLVIEPPETELALDRPGVLCTRDGNIQLFARGVDGSVWWQNRRDREWASEWTLVPDTVATSGLTLVGYSPSNFHVFHRGIANELRHGEYDGGSLLWTSNHDQVFTGTPVAHFHHAEWWEAFVRAGPQLFNYYRWFGEEGWVGPREEIFSDPAAAHWYDENVYVFTRNAQGRLRRFWITFGGYPPLVDTNLVPPPGTLTAVARAPGHFDIIVSDPGQPVWHAWWPRDPTP